VKMERRSHIILPAVFNLPSLSASRLGPTAILQPQFYLPSSSIQYSSLDSVGQGASATTVLKGKYLDKVVAIKKYAISNPLKTIILLTIEQVVITDHSCLRCLSPLWCFNTTFVYLNPIACALAIR